MTRAERETRKRSLRGKIGYNKSQENVAGAQRQAVGQRGKQRFWEGYLDHVYDEDRRLRAELKKLEAA